MARQRKDPKRYITRAYKTKLCQQCGVDFYDHRTKGRAPKFCSDRCKQKAYREAKKAMSQ